VHRTVIDMAATSPAANDHEAPGREGVFPATIEEVLALDAAERQRLLAQLRHGRGGPRIIVHVPQLVRQLAPRSEQEPRFDLDG
jgi:hypothetical protein